MTGFLTFFIIFTYAAQHAFSRAIMSTHEIRDLFTVNTDAQNNFDDAISTWSISSTKTPQTFDCNDITFLGGQNIFDPGSNIQISYSTPASHNLVYFTVTASFTGDWYNSIDGFLMTFTDGSSTTSIVDWQHLGVYKTTYPNCSVTDFQIKGKTPHSGSLLNIKFTYRGSTATGSAGFRKVNLRLATESSATQSFCVSANTFYANNLAIGSLCDCEGNYYNSGTGCSPCDDSCEGCSGPSASQCIVCKYGYYHDGTQCTQCTLTCTDCETCGICPDFEYYMDNTCIPKCELPFIPFVQYDRRYCLSPCSATQVVYSDGTCNTTCIAPFSYPLAVDYTRQVCQSLCTSGQVQLPDGACMAGPCPYPRFNKVYAGSMPVCEYPCPNYPSEIYYKHNQSCMSSCNFPFVTVTYGAFSACEPPCSGSDYSHYWDGSCQTNCVPLLQQRTLYGVQVCDPPQCGAVLCSACSSPGNTCPDYYYCNTTIGKFCFPYYKYTLNVEMVRPTLNGVVVTVDVVPVLGITTADDILQVKLYGLTLGKDYTFNAKRLSKGSYEVEIIINLPINSTAPKASFTFAPNTLLISADYTLTRLTYINEGVQAAAQDSKQGSQIAFLMFLISIIGMVLSGGFTAIWTALPESQYAYYLLYLNIDFLHHTEVYFQSLSNYDILVSSGEDEEHLDLAYRDLLPRKFYFMDYDPDFIGNCGELVIQAIGSISVLILSAVIVKHVRFSGRGIVIMRLMRYIHRSLHWNLIIRQIMTYTLPVFIACFVQIYSLIFGQNVYWPSLVLMIMSLLAFPLFFVKTFALVSNAPNNKYALSTYSRRFGTLWEDLDVTMKTKYYYWLVAIRAGILAYALVFFSPFPYVQIIVLIIYQALIVSLFFGLSPFGIRLVFGDKTLNKITLLEEICLLTVKILMLVFHTMIGTVGDKTLILMGWVIIIPATVAQVAQIFYSFWAQTNNCDNFNKLNDLWKSMTGAKKLKKILRIKKSQRRAVRLKV